MVDKPRNGGQWTEARLTSFIASALRQALTRWNPKSVCIKSAWIKRGVYRCSGCGTIGPASLPPKEGNKKRRKNILADHIEPIVDPAVGFVDWDTWIARAFVEEDKLQALCWQCHTDKTAEERAVATERRRKEKLNGGN